MPYPFYKQKTPHTCGPAAMRLALKFLGIQKSEKRLIKLLGATKARGTLNKAFPKLAEQYKLNYLAKRNSSLTDLKEYQKRGFIIIIGYIIPQTNEGHYAVLKKIDNKNIYLYDPWFGPKHQYSLARFKKIWKNDPRYDNEKRWFFGISKS